MRITAAMIVLNGDHVLRQSLQSIYNFVDEIVIAEGPVRFWQDRGVNRSSDRTIEIIKDFPDYDKKIKLISSSYSEKDEQFEAALSLISKTPNYLIQVDSDEVWSDRALVGLSELLKEQNPISVGVHSNTFVGGFDRVITGFEEKTDNFLRVFKWEEGCKFITHRPPTISYRNGSTTRGKSHVDSDEARDFFEISMCHYSYVWPSQVKSKIEYYKAKVSMQNCIPDFYENYWLPWTKTKNVQEKWDIESKILGMHEFKPEIRGPAFTKKFSGEHPSSIINSIDELQNRIQRELENE